MAKSLFFSGDFEQAIVNLDKAVALYEPDLQRRYITRRTHDSGIDAIVYRMWTLFPLGYPEAAEKSREQMITGAREIGHVYTLMVALHGAAWHHLIWTRNSVAADAATDEIFMLVEKHDAPFWEASALQQRGFSLIIAGKHNEAIGYLSSGLATYRSTGATLGMPTLKAHFALAHAGLGELEVARQYIEEALATVATTKERYFEAGVLQIASQIALLQRCPDSKLAELYLTRGLEFCRERSIKGTELRLSLDLARLWRENGKTREAYGLLAPVYNWFTEGFDWIDMKQAKALLEELRVELRIS